MSLIKSVVQETQQVGLQVALTFVLAIVFWVGVTAWMLGFLDKLF